MKRIIELIYCLSILYFHTHWNFASKFRGNAFVIPYLSVLYKLNRLLFRYTDKSSYLADQF